LIFGFPVPEVHQHPARMAAVLAFARLAWRGREESGASPPKKKKASLSAPPEPLAAWVLRVPSPTALGAPATGKKESLLDVR
jgi:hypothetical protein